MAAAPGFKHKLGEDPLRQKILFAAQRALAEKGNTGGELGAELGNEIPYANIEHKMWSSGKRVACSNKATPVLEAFLFQPSVGLIEHVLELPILVGIFLLLHLQGVLGNSHLELLS